MCAVASIGEMRGDANAVLLPAYRALDEITWSNDVAVVATLASRIAAPDMTRIPRTLVRS